MNIYMKFKKYHFIFQRHVSYKNKEQKFGKDE